MIDVTSLPVELRENRERIEGMFIFCLYHDTILTSDYGNVKNGEDIITPDGIFYFGLLNNMVKQGYEVIDNISVYAYLEEQPTLKKGFEKRGGWQTIKEIRDTVSTENIDKYYDDLTKSNMLIRLYGKGFNVIKNFDKFKEMTSEQVYDFFDYQLSDISVGKIEKLQPKNLSIGYDEYINEWDKGSEVGFTISSAMMNYRLLGIHKKNLLLHLAGIGQGKTSSTIAWYILPTITQQDVVILCNEQDESEWRQMILATVCFEKFGGVKGFDRHRMKTGSYTPEMRESMKMAEQWLASQKGKILFYDLNDYNISTIKKIVRRQARLGASLFIVDTLKPQDDSSDKAWGQFSEVAKSLFLLSKQLDVAIVGTCQLSPDSLSRSYLDLTCIAKARAIAETATQVVMFREVKPEEYDKLKPYKFEGKIKKELSLDPNKQYIVVFTPKNRFGGVDPQIIMERNLNFNTYKDFGYVVVPYDYGGRR